MNSGDTRACMRSGPPAVRSAYWPACSVARGGWPATGGERVSVSSPASANIATCCGAAIATIDHGVPFAGSMVSPGIAMEAAVAVPAARLTFSQPLSTEIRNGIAAAPRVVAGAPSSTRVCGPSATSVPALSSSCADLPASVSMMSSPREPRALVRPIQRRTANHRHRAIGEGQHDFRVGVSERRGEREERQGAASACAADG